MRIAEFGRDGWQRYRPKTSQVIVHISQIRKKLREVRAKEESLIFD
jgi:hypothetical protein